MSILHVTHFCAFPNIEKCYFLACTKTRKSFFLKTRMSKKRTCPCRVWSILGPFLQFLSKNGCCIPRKWQKLFFENKNPRFWDMIQPLFNPKTPSPENGKSDFLKTRMLQKGTCLNFCIAPQDLPKIGEINLPKMKTRF